MIGTIVEDSFEITRLIGEGGFGVVYECKDLQLSRMVALKMLRRARASEKDLQRFLSEGRNLASLNHPNVVHIYRLGMHGEDPYMAMEYVKGRTLRELTRGESLPLAKAVGIMRQAAAGIHAIHSTGILHRDLSTGNIMVTDDGTTKILDLGLSRDLNSLTSQNQLVGTIAYLSPEQIDHSGSSIRAEVFSFGVILYEILAGSNPFWSDHHMSMLYNIAHRTPAPIESKMPSCPQALAQLVHECLEKRPEDRPVNMAEVESSLVAILKSLGSDVLTASVRLTPAHERSQSAARNPYLNRVMIKRREQFFGREQEIRRIFARLNTSPPGSISVVGDRKIGKSSLLNYVYMRPNRQMHLENPQKMIMVFLDLQEEKNMSMESFVRKLLGIAAYELRGRLEVSDCSLDLSGIKDMVQRLDAANFHLTILLDEFDAVTTNTNFDLEFFSFLRFLANHYNVAYLTSSARDLQVLCHTKEISDSPFFNIFSTMRLSVFQREEAEQLVCGPSAEAGKPLAPYLDQIVDMAGMFPFFLQIACSHVLEWMDEHPNTTPDFAGIRNRFFEEPSFISGISGTASTCMKRAPSCASRTGAACPTL